MKRQIDIIEAGGVIHQETRSFDAANGSTFSLRSKELAHDYRYFPEPDLQPLTISQKQIDDIKATMPALPQQLFAKYTKEFGLSDYDAMVLTNEKEIAMWYEALIQKTSNYKAACNWLIGPIKAYLNENAIEIEDFKATPDQIAGIIHLVDSGKVSTSTAAEKILPVLASDASKQAQQVAEDLNLIQDADDDFIKTLAKEILAAYPEKVENYKKGNKGMLGLFMGELMKKSQGKANPKTATTIIQELLQD
jgi:aspartyl-tRNA(Asn)/glutamyl-tRNA(Gln) amidotransferase subunit B